MRNKLENNEKDRAEVRQVNLTTLLAHDAEAKQLFRTLPQPIQAQLTHAAEDVASLAALREYAFNLLVQEAKNQSFTNCS